MTSPPRIIWIGLSVVLAAAAVLSFDGLRHLALAVGIWSWLAWLLPVTIDAGAAVSCATWLLGRAPADAARFAGRMTWALLATSVVGNAAQLGMHAHQVQPPWWVAATIGAIAPVVVGTTVHLVVLLVRGPRSAGNGKIQPDKIQDDIQPEPVTVGEYVESLEVTTQPLEIQPEPELDVQESEPSCPVIQLPGLDISPDVRDRAWKLVLAGKGRGTLQKELGLNEGQAKRLCTELKSATNGKAVV